MIDTAGNERNLKNIRQIGTPTEEDKIYIENAAYQRVHADEYASRRVFVFMGHTECEEGRYTTFIEAAIPVPDIAFSQNIPKWDNRTWADIFHEVKRAYEDYIIVGWALDIRGFTPRMNRELEEVHREQFGGAHQMLLLMDSLEGEEYFYVNKGSRLQKWEGFYIYFCSQPGRSQTDVSLEIPLARRRRQERYRQAMHEEQETAYTGRRERFEEDRHTGRRAERERDYEPVRYRRRAEEDWDYEPRRREGREEQPAGGRRASSYAMAAAIVLLISMVGVGVYQDRIEIPGVKDAINTMSSGLTGKRDEGSDAEVLVGTELPQETQEEGSTQTASDEAGLIPVEEVPSGEIKKADSTQQEETETGDASEEDEETGADAKETKKDTDSKKADKKGGDKKASDSDSDKKDSEEKDSEETAGTAADVPEYYIVKRGDTLTAICRDIYGSSDYMDRIAELNGLDDSNDIRVGQKLLLP